jgi:hypothetical protein
MGKLYKEGDDMSKDIKVGDILEIKSGVFVKVKEVKVTEEDLAGTIKTNLYLKGEIISNENGKTRANGLKQTGNSRQHS